MKIPKSRRPAVIVAFLVLLVATSLIYKIITTPDVPEYDPTLPTMGLKSTNRKITVAPSEEEGFTRLSFQGQKIKEWIPGHAEFPWEKAYYSGVSIPDELPEGTVVNIKYEYRFPDSGGFPVTILMATSQEENEREAFRLDKAQEDYRRSLLIKTSRAYAPNELKLFVGLGEGVEQKYAVDFKIREILIAIPGNIADQEMMTANTRKNTYVLPALMNREPREAAWLYGLSQRKTKALFKFIVDGKGAHKKSHVVINQIKNNSYPIGTSFNHINSYFSEGGSNSKAVTIKLQHLRDNQTPAMLGVTDDTTEQELAQYMKLAQYLNASGLKYSLDLSGVGSQENIKEKLLYFVEKTMPPKQIILGTNSDKDARNSLIRETVGVSPNSEIWLKVPYQTTNQKQGKEYINYFHELVRQANDVETIGKVMGVAISVSINRDFYDDLEWKKFFSELPDTQHVLIVDARASAMDAQSKYDALYFLMAGGFLSEKVRGIYFDDGLGSASGSGSLIYSDGRNTPLSDLIAGFSVGRNTKKISKEIDSTGVMECDLIPGVYEVKCFNLGGWYKKEILEIKEHLQNEFTINVDESRRVELLKSTDL
jgi:hypothetical protein